MRCPVLVSALTCDPSSGSGSAVDPESETVCDPASVTSCGHGTATATGGIGDPSCGPARTSVACPCRSSDPPLTPSSATPRRQPQRHPRRLVPPVPAGSPPLPWSPARALARPNKELRAGLVTREANPGPGSVNQLSRKVTFRQKYPDFSEPISLRESRSLPPSLDTAATRGPPWRTSCRDRIRALPRQGHLCAMQGLHSAVVNA